MTKKACKATEKPAVLREINGKRTLQNSTKKSFAKPVISTAKELTIEKMTQPKKRVPMPASIDDICTREVDSLITTIQFLENLCHKHGLSTKLEALQHQNFLKKL